MPIGFRAQIFKKLWKNKSEALEDDLSSGSSAIADISSVQMFLAFSQVQYCWYILSVTPFMHHLNQE